MKILKPHFWYNKRQRNGVLFLLLIIIILQITYAFVDTIADNKVKVDDNELIAFQNNIDSLKAIEIVKRKPKLYPFNPNFITDYKGYQLGMSVKEIDRLHKYRKKRKFVNSAKEFQQLTKVSDSLLNKISPYFKFPSWVVKRNQKKYTKNTYVSKKEPFSLVKEKEIKKINVNTATFKEILAVPNIDYNLCKKIVEYRDEVAEIQDINELKNIEGFPVENFDKIAVYLKAE